MNHETEITEVEQLSNGQFAIHICCCGTHEHRKTIGPDVLDVDRSIQEGHEQAAKEHEAALQIKNKLGILKGQKKQHK